MDLLKMYEPTTKATPVWMAYLPKNVSLYYVNYNDNLNGHHDLLQKCIQSNSYTPIDEVVYDFWDYPEGEYLNEIRHKMWEDGFLTEYEESVDEIREWLWEHDESEPVKNLLINTRFTTMFYSLGIELDHGYHYDFMVTPWRNQSCKQSANRIRQALGIKKGTAEDAKILELCENSTYGGELRIYFNAGVEQFVTNGDDWETIKFNGVFKVAVWDNTNGAGDFVELKLDREFPFIRENLQISDVAEEYDIESVCGLCGDWLRNCDIPQGSFEKIKKSRRIKPSKALSREQEFQKIYDAGGCSCDDENMSRHHGVYYCNEFPCGWICPQCRKIWYD